MQAQDLELDPTSNIPHSRRRPRVNGYYLGGRGKSLPIERTIGFQSQLEIEMKSCQRWEGQTLMIHETLPLM